MNWLVVNTLTAAVLALLTLAIGRCCRTAPAVMHGLWLFVLLKLVTPPLFEVPIDLSWAREPAPVRTVVLPLSLATPAAPAVAAPAALTSSAGAVAAPVAWTWERLVVAVWALGATAMLAWFAIGCGRVRRRLRTFAPVPAWLRREVAELAGSLGVPVPDLRDDPQAPSPYVWSFGRTCLVLPVRILAGTPPRGRAAVLAHELAHLRRNDHWLAHGEVVFAAALWWHPLFWFARARMRLWAELACDAWALAAVPDSSHAYATVLVEAAARPDPSVPASVVLAARPAARAAFERRLTMILNENVPCRASRAWWLPFTSLALGLFAMPVAAQKGAQDPVRVEIRVNGKQVEDLNSAERTALLEQLLGAEKKAAAKKQRKVAVRVESEDADAVPSEPVPPRARRTAPVVVEGEPAIVEPTPTSARKRSKPVQRAQGEPFEMEIDLSELQQLEGLDLKAMFGEGLAEARLEILGDEDLRELGITDEVVRLLDDVEAGKGITNSLDEVIRGALQGASKLVEKELRADPELAELGMADGLLALVNGLLQNEGNQKLLAGFVRNLLDEAVAEAKVEIRADADLRELGIAGEVESLLEAVLRGGDAAGELQGLVDKATKAALQHAESEAVVEPREEPAPPEAQPKPKSKSAKKAKPAKRSSTEVESAPK